MATVSLPQAMELARTYIDAKRFADAKYIYEQVAARDPNNPVAWYWLGDISLREGDAAAAIPWLERAARMNPHSPQCQTRLGFALLGVQRNDDAAAAFRRAIDLDANFAGAHYGLSWTMLAAGDFERGWVEHEWRATCNNLPGKVRNFEQPRWDGHELRGQRILLYQEQGLGDVLQYVRYAPMVAARGGQVVLGCTPEMGALLQRTPGVAEIAPNPDRLPPFALHQSLHSLPLIFGTRLETIPADVPYVHPSADAVERWRQRIDRSTARLHVGLCWAGSPKHENDLLRSIDPAMLATLAEVPNVRFYAVQREFTVEHARRLPSNLNLTDFGPDLMDFNETAAAMANLDLVISVDTSMAHLAGALARPTWTLLPFHADWRWMLQREDSPWYPTMRLFRQQSVRDWPGVLQRVAAELRTMAAA